MEKDRKRAIRRHHIARLKNTRKHYFNATWIPTPKQLGKIVQYPAMCSCFMCGNARKWWKHHTISELRDFEQFDYDMEEIYLPD